MQALAERLNQADTVTLFCGAGVEGAHDEVIELAGTLLSPIGHTLRGKEWIQHDNPYDVGMTGLLGLRRLLRGHERRRSARAAGDRLPVSGFPARQRTPCRSTTTRPGWGDARRWSLAVHGDVRETLRAVLPLRGAEAATARSWTTCCTSMPSALEHVVSAYTHDIEHHLPIHPEYAARILDEVASDEAIFTVDTGMNNVWAARYITPNGRRRVIGSFRHGSMANALPHAIGAQLAYPGRQVISMSGDGGLACCWASC